MSRHADFTAHRNGRLDQGPCLEAVKPFQLRYFQAPSFRVNIPHLPLDHPAATGRLGQLIKDSQPNGLLLRGLQRGVTGQLFKCFGQKRITGQYGGGFAKNHVASGAPSAKFVVIHGREIVVNKRIGVHHFQRAAGR